MSNGNGSNNVSIVAIIAILILVGFAAWFVWGRPASRRAVTPTTAPAASPGSDADVKINVDLPDTVNIK